MAENTTAGIFQRMQDAGIAKGKREGRDVGETLRRIIDFFLFSMGQQQGATVQQQPESNQAALDRLANTIEINSAIVQSVCAIVVAHTGRIIGATPPADAMFGYAVGELAGRGVDIIELVPETLRETYNTYWQRFWDDPRNVGVASALGSATQTVDSVRMQARRLTGEEITIKVGWSHPVFVLNQRAVVAQIMHVPLWQLELEEKQRKTAQPLGS